MGGAGTAARGRRRPVATLVLMPATASQVGVPSRVLLAAPRGYCAGVDRAVQTVEQYFVGLPIPAAAAMNAAMVLLWERAGFGIETNQLFILIMLYVLAFLMVSNIKYVSLKRAELFKRMNFNVLVAIILILIFIAAKPSIALFIVGFLYVVSGPIMLVLRFMGLKRKKTKSLEIDEQRTSP